MHEVLSGQAIETHVARISAQLDELASDGSELSPCVDIAERFELLREQYRSQPQTLELHTRGLADLRQRFDELLGDLMPRAIDRLHDVNGQLRRLEMEKEFWRQVVIRRAVETGQEILKGRHSFVLIRAVPGCTLPPRDIGQRKELEDIVDEAGCRAQVSYLSASKLHKLMSASTLEAADQKKINELCPVVTRHQVSSRLLNSVGRGPGRH